MTGSRSRWWDRERHAGRRPGLILRSRLKSALRAWFENEAFTEVECGILQTSPGNETHLHGVRAFLPLIGQGEECRYLHTSPEFAAKKLLAAGEERIFEFARVFRGREVGPLNVPEFTMLEWYRAGADFREAMADAAAIIEVSAERAQCRRVEYKGRAADPSAKPAEKTCADAFNDFAGIDLLSTLTAEGNGEAGLLAEQMSRQGIDVGQGETWSDLFSRVISERIEPNLGIGRPEFLTFYPAPEAALARRSVADPRLSERFELYLCGVEIANGFSELTDPAEQRRRFEEDMDEKERRYGERYPIDEDFISALGLMPEATGVALGFDRLVMLLAGARSVDDVQWTPYDR